VHKISVDIIKFNFEESHPHCVNRITKYQICVAVQSEHNCVILLSVIQHTNYMFRPLYLTIIRFVLSLQSNCITYQCI